MRPSTRWLLGLVVIAIPALFFLPGIGVESSSPAALARTSAPPDYWYYRVQRGDVLSRIAERELGTFKRYREILKLNPDIKPRTLTPGAVLRMPPRTPRSADPAPAASPAPAVSESSDSRGLLLSFAALLGALVLVIVAAGRLERRNDGA